MTSERGGRRTTACWNPRTQARADFYALLVALVRHSARCAAPRCDRGSARRSGRGGRRRRSHRARRAWDSLRAASARRRSGGRGRGIPDPVRRRGQERGAASTRRTISGPSRDARWPRFGPALAALGLARRAASSEFEDHLSVVLETMRMLVAGDADRPPAPIADQRAFCERHVAAVGARLLHCNIAMSSC